MFQTLGWNPTPSSHWKCIGVLGLCPKSVLDPGIEPHTLQSLEMHQGLVTLSKKCSQPWDGTPHPPVIEMHWGLKTLSKKCSGPWDGTSHPPGIENALGSGTLSKKCSQPWDGTPHPPVFGNALGSWDSVSKVVWTSVAMALAQSRLGVGVKPRLELSRAEPHQRRAATLKAAARLKSRPRVDLVDNR